MSYRLRPATAADYTFLFDLHRAVMREYIQLIWGWREDWQEEYFRQKFDPLQRQIIQVDGRDAGVLVVEHRPEEIYLGLIEMLPEFQGRGVGSTIIMQLQREADRLGLPLTLHVLRTNEPARRLYERLGFQVTGEEADRYAMKCGPREVAGNQFPSS